MNNSIEYKGYVGSVESSDNDRVLYSKVQGIHPPSPMKELPLQSLLPTSTVLLTITSCFARRKAPNRKTHTRAASASVSAANAISAQLSMPVLICKH